MVPLHLKSATVWKEIPFSLLAGVFILVFGSDYVLDGIATNAITRTDGIALLGMFIIFIVYTLGVKKSGEQPEGRIEIHTAAMTAWLVFSGIVGLAVGGYITVEGAVGLALGLGISENLVGLTIVAIGTSLPEVVTTIQAARKNHIDMAVGGVVGSVIFNALFVLGTTAVLHPLPFSEANIFDALAVLTATIVLFFALFSGKKGQLGRMEGMLFIAMYFGFIAFAIFRG